MNLALCSIQRNRAPWLHEWIAFHHAVGFKKFYVFLHKCEDHSAQVLLALSQHFDITAFVVPEDEARPQLAAYHHCYRQFGHEHDWLGFIDGDEFLFSPQGVSVADTLAGLDTQGLGALGVYWACFGSSNHVAEPQGLITHNYRYRAPLDFAPNRHFKSLVKGRQGAGFAVGTNAHFFHTALGTQDTQGRSLTHGFAPHAPNHEILRINHYVTQSWNFFKHFKQKSGAADGSPALVRPDSWWHEHNRNDVMDGSLLHIDPLLLDTLRRTGYPI